MPLFEKSVIEATYSEEVEDPATNQKEAQPTSTMDDLLGLDITAPAATPAAPVANSAALVDLLGVGAPVQQPPQPVQDILGGMLSTPAAPGMINYKSTYAQPGLPALKIFYHLKSSLQQRYLI